MAFDGATVRNINGKKVYIVENHHEVIIPWAEYASEHASAPVLLTFDHHADTRTAFSRHAMDIGGEKWKALSARLTAEVDYHEPESMVAALAKLRNNEHIDLALKAGIISHAVVFSLMGMGICKDYSNDRICYVDPECTSICKKNAYDNDCRIEALDSVIETRELQSKLKHVNRFITDFYALDGINRKYILDVDLDCFNTMKAMEPDDMELFKELVVNAEIITIATEPDYVEMEKIDADIHADLLLDRLLAHIKNIMENNMPYIRMD